jgi:hypothetical protein
MLSQIKSTCNVLITEVWCLCLPKLGFDFTPKNKFKIFELGEFVQIKCLYIDIFIYLFVTFGKVY